MNFPVFSQLAGNFRLSETSSLLTASSSGESDELPTKRRGRRSGRCGSPPVIDSAGRRSSVSQPREFRGMEFHEVGHARRRLAGKLEVVLAHPVIAPLFVGLGHHREVVDGARGKLV